jgi:hypothetical protein
VGLSPAECERGQEAIRSVLAELDRRATDPKSGAIWSTVAQMLSDRDAFVLDHCDVNVDITPNGIARVNLDPITKRFFVSGGCENSKLWGSKGAGYATMLLSRRAGVPYFAVCYEGEVIFEFAHADSISTEEKQRHRDLALGVGTSANLMEAWHAYMRERTRVMNGSPADAKPRLGSLLSNVGRVSERLYARLSMPPWLTEQEAVDAATRLASNGIAQMFPQGRMRLLPVMVGWSLGKAHRKHLDALFSKTAPNESMLHILNEVNAKAKSCWGADLFVVENGSIVTITV